MVISAEIWMVSIYIFFFICFFFPCFFYMFMDDVPSCALVKVVCCKFVVLNFWAHRLPIFPQFALNQSQAPANNIFLICSILIHPPVIPRLIHILRFLHSGANAFSQRSFFSVSFTWKALPHSLCHSKSHILTGYHNGASNKSFKCMDGTFKATVRFQDSDISFRKQLK